VIFVIFQMNNPLAIPKDEIASLEPVLGQVEALAIANAL
jgi:hypothetical protein